MPPWVIMASGTDNFPFGVVCVHNIGAATCLCVFVADLVCVFAAQPVHDELEYIKMRYRSPARSSFRTARHKKTYDTSAPASTPHNHVVTPTPPQTYMGDQTNIYANDSVTKDGFVSPDTSWVQTSPLLDSRGQGGGGGGDHYTQQEYNPYTSLVTTPPAVTIV